MAIKFSNNASAALAGAISSTATSISVVAGQGSLFPAITSPDYFYATLVSSSNAIEIVKVTARSADVLTVIRAQDGTAAQAFMAGDKLELRVTAAAMSDVASGSNLSGTYAISISGNAATATTATNATNATNATAVAVADDVATNATYYPVLATANSGNAAPKTSSTKLSYNPSTGTFTSTAIADAAGNVRSIPINAKTAAYTLAATDNGQCVSITTGGVTIPASVFSAGQVVTLYNNSAASQTITQGTGLTLQWAGQSASTTGNRTLGLYGLCTVLFISPTVAVINGAGLT